MSKMQKPEAEATKTPIYKQPHFWAIIGALGFMMLIAAVLFVVNLVNGAADYSNSKSKQTTEQAENREVSEVDNAAEKEVADENEEDRDYSYELSGDCEINSSGFVEGPCTLSETTTDTEVYEFEACETNMFEASEPCIGAYTEIELSPKDVDFDYIKLVGGEGGDNWSLVYKINEDEEEFSITKIEEVLYTSILVSYEISDEPACEGLSAMDVKVGSDCYKALDNETQKEVRDRVEQERIDSIY